MKVYLLTTVIYEFFYGDYYILETNNNIFSTYEKANERREKLIDNDRRTNEVFDEENGIKVVKKKNIDQVILTDGDNNRKMFEIKEIEMDN